MDKENERQATMRVLKGEDYTKLGGRSTALKERLAKHALITAHPEAVRETMVRRYGEKADLLKKVKIYRPQVPNKSQKYDLQL